MHAPQISVHPKILPRKLVLYLFIMSRVYSPNFVANDCFRPTLLTCQNILIILSRETFFRVVHLPALDTQCHIQSPQINVFPSPGRLVARLGTLTDLDSVAGLCTVASLGSIAGLGAVADPSAVAALGLTFAGTRTVAGLGTFPALVPLPALTPLPASASSPALVLASSPG